MIYAALLAWPQIWVTCEVHSQKNCLLSWQMYFWYIYFAIKSQFDPLHFFAWADFVSKNIFFISETFQVIYIIPITQELIMYEAIIQYEYKTPELFILPQKILETPKLIYLCPCYKKF